MRQAQERRRHDEHAGQVGRDPVAQPQQRVRLVRQPEPAAAQQRAAGRARDGAGQQRRDEAHVALARRQALHGPGRQQRGQRRRDGEHQRRRGLSAPEKAQDQLGAEQARHQHRPVAAGRQQVGAHRHARGQPDEAGMADRVVEQMRERGAQQVGDGPEQAERLAWSGVGLAHGYPCERSCLIGLLRRDCVILPFCALYTALGMRAAGGPRRPPKILVR